MKNRRRDDADLDALRDPSLSPLHAALTAPAAQDELGRHREALAAYRAVTWDRRGLWRPAVLATKLGVATAAGVIGLSGVATAAYTGSLPNALQDVAHKTIKAPAATSKANGVGPDATGDAAWGLCQAFGRDKGKDDQAKEQRKAAERAQEQAAEWAREQAAERAAGATSKATPPGQGKKAERAQKPAKAQDRPGRGHGKPDGAGQELGNGHGEKGKKSVAYRNLVRAAGGEDKVEAYCATIPKPSGEPDADEPKAKPSTSPKAAKPSKSPQPRSSARPSVSSSPAASSSASPSSTATATAPPS